MRWRIANCTRVLSAQHIERLSLGSHILEGAGELWRREIVGLRTLLVVQQILFQGKVKVNAQTVGNLLAQVDANRRNSYTSNIAHIFRHMKYSNLLTSLS